MTKTAWIDEELQSLKEQGLLANIRTIESPMGAWLQIEGKRVLNFCANNYLGLANHPRLVEVLKRQAERNCHSALAGMTHEAAALLGEAARERERFRNLADRLADREAVDARGNPIGVLALEQMRNTARELDDLDAARHDIADDDAIGARIELCAIETLVDLDAEFAQLRAHGRIDVLV